MDARFNTNPLVTSDPAIRFFAGVALFTADGEPLGTLCVVDMTPRILAAEQAQRARRAGPPGERAAGSYRAAQSPDRGHGGKRQEPAPTCGPVKSCFELS